jgi:hypothetical protein
VSIIDNIKRNLVYRLLLFVSCFVVFFGLEKLGFLDSSYTVVIAKSTPDDITTLAPDSYFHWEIQLKEMKKGRFAVVETLTLPSPPRSWYAPEGSTVSTDGLSCTTKRLQRLIYTSTFNGNWRIPTSYPEGLYRLDVTIDDKLSKSFYFQLCRSADLISQKEVEVFRGTPTVRYDMQRDKVKKDALTANTAVDNICHIVKRGNYYYWKSRNDEMLLLLDSGPYSSAYYFVSLKGAGLIKVLDLSTSGFKEVQYMEQVSTLLASITYFGEADYFFKSTTRK